MWVRANCPKCEFNLDLQLIDIKTERTIFCHNCKTMIKLQDGEASAHTGIKQLGSVVNQIDELFKNFGK